MSKTQQALAWLAKHPNASAASAAREFGLSRSTITRAIKVVRETADRRCPCCNQIVPRGSALRDDDGR